MKRMMILLFVLCAASTASAGFIFDIEGDEIQGGTPAMTLGDTATLQIIGEPPVPVNAALYVAVFGDAVSIDGGTMDYTGNLSSYYDLEDVIIAYGYVSTDDLLADFHNFGLVGLTDLSAVTLADGSATPAPLTGPLVHGIAVSADRIGVSTIDLLDEALVTIDTLTVEVVPEPVSIALLGLGALFVRRRR